MSHYMTALAMKQKGLKPAAKIVLYWIADHHNGETDQCNPSINRLAQCCEMSRRSVENHIAELQALGLIEVSNRYRDQGGKTANSYTLCMTGSDAQNLRMGSAKSAHGGCAKSAHDRTLEDTNLGNEPSLALVAPENVTPDMFEEFWHQYPHRNGAKKGKDDARKAWRKVMRASVPPDRVIGAALRYANDRQVLDGYAKDPATWLNKKGWEDDIETDHGRSGSGRSGSGNAMVDAFAAVAAERVARNRGG